jgi:Heparinase II/III-like protein/Heparinase II/III N-terminus
MTTLQQSRLAWYARRLGRMSAGELAWRCRDKIVQAAWSTRQVRTERPEADESARPGQRQFTARLPAGTASLVPEAARSAVLAAARRLLAGEWEVLGVARTDMISPDWFFDPVTGRRAPAERYAFRINHRSEGLTGNVKQIWEISRLQHLTLLATAWFVSHDDAYAQLVSEQLRSWWRENPFLSGVNWTSGIEIGIRLISMTWIRRLLNEWPGVAGLFDDSDLALHQIRDHQRYLATFSSRGSSANNHVIAEAAGQLIASCAFPWFAESEAWRKKSARLLERELARNTFPSGINRELASDYHCFVAELGLLAAVESAAAGYPLSPAAWHRLGAMVDSAAALLDERLQPPRQGDGDEGAALLLDPPMTNRWPSLLAVGEEFFGRLDWWPETTPDAASSILGAMPLAARDVPGRPARRPWRFPDAGTTLLRTTVGRDPEIWCRCDGGPHGYLSIAAHAHADALSVEIRYGGVNVLADPGTFCYHGEYAWRSYFRSTVAHNTVEVDGRSQSEEGGPFLWLAHANASEVNVVDIGDAAEWTAEHDGYLSLSRPARHRRCVRLDRASRSVDIVDEISGGDHDVRLAFHFGPEVEVEIEGGFAILCWPSAPIPGTAMLELAQPLRWSMHRGETDPILGWYSCGLGRRTPAVTLIGQGRSDPARPFVTRLEFIDVRPMAQLQNADSAVSWSPSGATARPMPDIQAEAG